MQSRIIYRIVAKAVLTNAAASAGLHLMDFDLGGGHFLRGLDRKNILLGKNGCGKSRLLKVTETSLRNRPNIGALRYLSPERGGLLQYQAGIEENLASNVGWLADSRRQNQASQFRQQSASQFRRLEILILREIEQTPSLRANQEVTFDKTVAKVNTLLDRVYIERADPSFRIRNKADGAPVTPDAISSGESELISLGIECLVFEKECQQNKYNLLMIDEPDVHLHPDLQARFARFIENLVSAGNFSLLIATHSTAFLGAMSEDSSTRLAFMRSGDTDIAFSSITDVQKKVLPVFGAHPLSNVFNQAPVLLVEGEDDERIWQQAVRSSRGRIKIYPCSVEGVTELRSFEQEVAKILQAVYDDAAGYSLRDRDMEPAELANIGPVKRLRLHCRAAENLLLTDEVLIKLGMTWPEIETHIRAWLEANRAHPHYAAMKVFADSGFDRLNSDLKAIRNDLMGIMGSNKPWEVLVGQVLASLETVPQQLGATSMAAFLGPQVCNLLLGLAPSAPSRS